MGTGGERRCYSALYHRGDMIAQPLAGMRAQGNFLPNKGGGGAYTKQNWWSSGKISTKTHTYRRIARRLRSSAPPCRDNQTGNSSELGRCVAFACLDGIPTRGNLDASVPVLTKASSSVSTSDSDSVSSSTGGMKTERSPLGLLALLPFPDRFVGMKKQRYIPK